MLYHYDGSFAGLLTVLAEIFAGAAEPTAIAAGEPQQGDLFAGPKVRPTDQGKAGRFLAAVERRLSPAAARRLLQAHASEAPEAPLVIYRYLKRARSLGSEIDRLLADPDVFALHRLARTVSRETHRLKGLIRYRQLADGLWYAPVEPRHAVLPFLAPHFARRRPGDDWLLHDWRRRVGVFGQGNRWRLEPLPVGRIATAATELECRTLWRAFYRAVAIPERIDPLRRRRHLPVYYWRHLVELDTENRLEPEYPPVQTPDTPT